MPTSSEISSRTAREPVLHIVPKPLLFEGGENLLSLFASQWKFDEKKYEKSVEVSGVVRPTHKGFTLVSVGKRSEATFKLPRAKSPLALTVWYHLESNPGHHFYTSVQGESGTEVFRAGKSTMSSCGSAQYLNSDFTQMRRVTFALWEKKVYAFVENQLFFVGREEIGDFRQLTFEIRPEEGDVEASIVGVNLDQFDREQFHEVIKENESRRKDSVNQFLKMADFDSLVSLLNQTPEASQFLDFSSLRSLVLGLSPAELSRVVESVRAVTKHLPENLAKDLNDELHSRLPEPLVRVKELNVQYDRESHRRFTLSRLLFKSSTKYSVLNDINFEVFPGDILGILGANGAGKSTLLKALSGILDVTHGSISLRGKHMLLAPGLGMRGELSGRENITLACCFMGIPPKESVAMVDEIIDFSELGVSIDQPFKFYSDGMKSRLVFSVATAVAPEVLMLDEILGAGDISFQQKASKRMDELLDKAKAVILVTHSLQIVERKCNKGLVIADGMQAFFGTPKEAVNVYLDKLYEKGRLSSEKLDKTGFLGEMN